MRTCLTGLDRFRHDLRHTCASLLLAEGVEPRVIMEILGHSVIGTTMTSTPTSCPSRSARPQRAWTASYSLAMAV